MKLPAIIRADTSAKLERARAERDKAQGVVADLRAKLLNLDVGSDDFTPAALTLSGQISVNERAIEILERQIEGLENKLLAEKAAEAAARRLHAIKKVETELLPRWPAAVEQYVQAVKAERAARAAMVEARKAIVVGWPLALTLPYAFPFDGDRVVSATQLGADLDDLTAIAREAMADLVAGLQQTPAAAESEERAA
jgi:hypothetical protein